MFSDYLKSLAGGDLEKTASAEYDPVNVVLQHREETELEKEARLYGPGKMLIGGSAGGAVGGATGAALSEEGERAKGALIGAGLGAAGGAGGALGMHKILANRASKSRVKGYKKEYAKAVKENRKAEAKRQKARAARREGAVKTAECAASKPKKAKNKLSAMVKKAQEPGVLQRLGALSALQRSGELGVPVEYRRGTALRGAQEARGGAIRGAVGGGLAGGGLGAAAGLGAGALLKSPRAGTAIGALLGGAGGATLGAGAGATQAGRRAAEGTKEDIQEAMWTRAVVRRQAQRAMAMQRLREIAASRHMQQGAYQMVPKVAAFNPFKDPTIMGTMIGGVTGAGLGVLSSENRDQKSLIRAGLIGAGMGGAIGGMSGALSKGVGATQKSHQKSHKQMQSTIRKATEEGFNKGWRGMADKILPRVKDLEAQLAAVKMR